MTIIYYPKGMYYGGLIAAPVVKNIFENILPYLKVPMKEKTGVYNETQQE